MLRDMRGSLLAKIIAIVLLMTTASSAALGFLGMLGLGAGWATADSYYEDMLCLDTMESAMHKTLWHFTEEYCDYAYDLDTMYQGICVQIFDGDAAEGKLIGAWDEVPEAWALQHSFTVDYQKDTAGYYTLVGYLPKELPRGGVFYLSQTLYGTLHPLSGGGIVIFTGVSLLSAALFLVFLLCAAGHRQGDEYVLPNWQDRIPLDLYLCISIPGIALLVALGVACLEEIRYTFQQVVLFLSLFVLCILAAGLLLLAALMTAATRLKLGKWWRNTVCYRLLRLCWRLWKSFWRMLAELLHFLPFTWRAIALVCSVLAAQTLLTLLIFENYNGGFFFLLTLAADGAFIVGAAWLVRQLQLLQKAAKALAEGDLEAKTDTKKMYFDCRRHAEHLNAISDGMTRAVEQRIKSERLKTELITNVSHDIKTPLTSIVNYVDLLKKEELPETAGEYVAVLDRQSRRLKKLTEDLVEASKASTGNVAVTLEPIVINEIIHQAIGDYNEKLSAGKLDVIVHTYEGSVMAMADGRLLWRVLDNLLNNICKYALAGTRVYVDLENVENRILLSMKNISRDPLNIRSDELTERFVRGDASRHTEGSGLGLNIAQSLMELMDGTFHVSVDGDLFKVELSLPIA